MKYLSLILLSAIGALAADEPGASAGGESKTWTDPATTLTWAASDNGVGVTYSQAVYYCRTLTLAGHNDWMLASIEDLHRLFGGPANENGHHVLAPIKLTGWQWSSSPGKERGEEWSLDFGDGQKASVVMGDSGLNRALCVRRSTD